VEVASEEVEAKKFGGELCCLFAPLADVMHLSNKTCALQGLYGDESREFRWSVWSLGDCKGRVADGWEGGGVSGFFRAKLW